MTDSAKNDVLQIRDSYLKTQVPWGNKEQYLICKRSEIDAAIQAAYNVGLLDAEFERMMNS